MLRIGKEVKQTTHFKKQTNIRNFTNCRKQHNRLSFVPDKSLRYFFPLSSWLDKRGHVKDM